MNPFRSFSTLHWALGISIGLHACLLMYRLADPTDFDHVFNDAPLEVVLVNAKSDTEPEQVQAIAQNNLQGGGDSNDRQRVTTPLPPSDNSTTSNAIQDAQKQIESMQEQQQQLLTQMRQEYDQLQSTDPRRDEGTPQSHAEEDLRRQRLQLLGEIEKRINQENSRPKKRYLSPSTRQSDEALYYDRFRRTVEREGTRSFPTARGQKLYGTLLMLVSLDQHGEVVAAEVAQTSGNAVLDRQAQAIARRSGPFGEVPPEMRKRAAIWVIASQFRFSREGSLETHAVSNPGG